MTPEKKVEIASSQLSMMQPFFGRFLLDMNIDRHDPIGTFATDGQRILYAGQFVDKLTIKEVKGCLVHEVLHIVFKHHLRLKHRDPQKANIAMDYVVDPIVLDTKDVNLPSGPGLEQHHDRQYDGHTWEHVYEIIPDPPKQPSDTQGGSQGDQEGSVQGDRGGSGNPEDQPAQGIGGVMEPKNEDGSKMTEAEKELAGQEIDQKTIVAAEAAKSRGNMPAGLKGYITSLREPQVDWETALRRFFRGDKPEDFTMENIDRGMYEMADILEPTIELKGIGHQIIAMDVSGSVSDSEIEHFLAEINRITEDLCPSKVTLIQCDAKIQSIEEYDEGEVIDHIKVRGRGGTLVQPVFEYVNENIFDAERLIYLTDMGIGDWGEPPEYPVMWVATTTDRAPYGETIPIKITR